MKSWLGTKRDWMFSGVYTAIGCFVLVVADALTPWHVGTLVLGVLLAHVRAWTRIACWVLERGRTWVLVELTDGRKFRGVARGYRWYVRYTFRSSLRRSGGITFVTHHNDGSSLDVSLRLHEIDHWLTARCENPAMKGR